MKRYNKLRYIAFFTQWIFLIGSYSSILLFTENPYTIALILGESIVILILLLFNISIKLFRIPKVVLTDRGYTYVDIVSRYEDFFEKKGYNIKIYKNYILFYLEINYERVSNTDIQNISRLKDKINYLHDDYLRGGTKTYSDRHYFNEWNGIATDKKEVLRDNTIEEIL